MIKEVMIALFFLLAAIGYSVYQNSDANTKLLLASKKWETNFDIYRSRIQRDNSNYLENIKQINVDSKIKFLTNNTYVRVSDIQLLSVSNDEKLFIHSSDSGRWEVKDNYLFINPLSFNDSPNRSLLDTDEELTKLVHDLYVADSKNVRLVESINKSTILLVGVDDSSRLLSAK